MTPTLTPLTVNTTDGVTHEGASPVAVSTMFVARNGKFARSWCCSRRVDPEVEFVVAVGRRVHPPGVLDVDRRACPRGGPSSAAMRRRCHHRPAAGPARAAGCFLVEQRRQDALRRRLARCDAVDGSVVGSSWPWKSLRPMIEIGLTAFAPLTISSRTRPWLCCGSGIAEQVGEGRREVDRPRRDLPLAIALPTGQEGRAHVDVVGEVLDIGHVAVLTEEQRPRDERAGRGGIELVRRVREHDEIAGPSRMGHVGGRALAVRDVAGLGLA